MTNTNIDKSQRTAAKVAGLAYLLSLATEVFSEFRIKPRLIVAGNPAETAQNILAHQQLFRLGIAGDLIYAVCPVALFSALYVILRPISWNLASLAALSRLVYAMTWVIIALSSLTALRLLSAAGYMPALGAEQLQALVKLYLSASDPYYIGLLFYALASTLCAYLWFRSRYISKRIGSLGCDRFRLVHVVYAPLYPLPRLLQGRQPVVVRYADGYFRVPMSFWLLFKGLASSDIATPNGPSDRAYLPDL
jgi:hypothetical protein